MSVPSVLKPRLVAGSGGTRNVRVVMIADEEEIGWYRTLGVSEDATYEQITDAYIELSESYAADPKRMAAIDVAKEKILDARLRQRMSGALRPTLDESPFEVKPIQRTPIWEVVGTVIRKMLRLPSRKEAGQVLFILGGLLLTTWVSPRSAGTCLLINTLSGFGYVYNNGTPEVPKDDFGQIGEIRPMKPKPMLLAGAITAAIWFSGYYQARRLVELMLLPKWLPELVLRTTYITGGLIVASLFLKVHDVFEY
jgi:hypothetical protein